VGERGSQALKGHQLAHAHLPPHHRQPAEAENGDAGDPVHRPRHHAQQGGGLRALLLRIEVAGLVAGPAAEGLRLTARGLQRLDHRQAAVGDGREAPHLPHQPTADIALPPPDQAQEQRIGAEQQQGDQCQRRIVERHDGPEEQQRRHGGDGGAELLRHHLRHALGRADAGGDVARVALREEFHRHAEDMPEQPRPLDHRELGLEPGGQRCLQGGQAAEHQGGEAETKQQRHQPALEGGQQYFVHKDLAEHRHRQPRHQ
jgi:hypothetical protein